LHQEKSKMLFSPHLYGIYSAPRSKKAPMKDKALGYRRTWLQHQALPFPLLGKHARLQRTPVLPCILEKATFLQQ
jgi:hypothetical protein